MALALLCGRERLSHPGLFTCILHLDHGIRKESRADMMFVRALAKRLALPFRFRSAAVSKRKGVSLEMAAREERLAFFRDSVSSLRLDAIATAHHADDAAETFFMRLARGAGLSGLSGLKRESRLPGLRIVRPLLHASARDIRRWLSSLGETWREDSTNSDTEIERNNVRHVVIPWLENHFDKSIRAHLARTLDILREEDEYLETATDAEIGRGVPLADMPLAIARRAARRELRERGMKDGWAETARRVSRASEPAEPQVDIPGTYTLEISPSKGWKRSTEGIGAFPSEAWIGAAAAGGLTLEMRTRRPGDRLRPTGSAGARKLKDIFIDAKTPKALRDSLPVLAIAGTEEVVWVPGCRVAEKFRVPGDDSESWHLKLKPGSVRKRRKKQ